MDAERPDMSISRRSMLKRIGAGTAIAWSAPVLSSLTAPAFGQADSPERCRWSCNPFVEVDCGNCGGGTRPICRCNATTEGDVFCWNGCTLCSDAPGCASSADCPAGQRCIPDNCCFTNKCFPECGVGTQSVGTGPLGGAIS